MEERLKERDKELFLNLANTSLHIFQICNKNCDKETFEKKKCYKNCVSKCKKSIFLIEELISKIN